MITEKSCGAVVFTRMDGKIRYAIIESRAGVYGFPKGHVEKNETELETARREVLEETGLKVEFSDNFRAEDFYPIRCAGEIRRKQVVYFLAEYHDQIPVAQESELNAVHLMDYESALASLQFEGARRILSEAHKCLLG